MDDAIQGYTTTTLYLDTLEHDVIKGTKGYRTKKYRVRRYHANDLVFLEEKERKGQRVAKRRIATDLQSVEAMCNLRAFGQVPNWFAETISERRLIPSLLCTYTRSAFNAPPNMPHARLTLDRNLRQGESHGYALALKDGQDMPYHVLELKFRDSLPNFFRDLIARLGLESTSFSKYRSAYRFREESVA